MVTYIEKPLLFEVRKTKNRLKIFAEIDCIAGHDIAPALEGGTHLHVDLADLDQLPELKLGAHLLVTIVDALCSHGQPDQRGLDLLEVFSDVSRYFVGLLLKRFDLHHQSGQFPAHLADGRVHRQVDIPLHGRELVHGLRASLAGGEELGQFYAPLDQVSGLQKSTMLQPGQYESFLLSFRRRTLRGWIPSKRPPIQGSTRDRHT